MRSQSRVFIRCGKPQLVDRERPQLLAESNWLITEMENDAAAELVAACVSERVELTPFVCERLEAPLAELQQHPRDFLDQRSDQRIPRRRAFAHDLVHVGDECSLLLGQHDADGARHADVDADADHDLRRSRKAQVDTLQARPGYVAVLLAAKRWLPRDADKVPAEAMPQLAQARAAHPVLDKMVTMREELRQLWLNRSQSREQLAADLQAWCRRAEDSGIAALRDFSLRLRAAHA